MCEDDILQAAVDKWGIGSQLIMLMEECAELIQATSKTIRSDSLNGLAEEIADVEIMLSQVKIMFPGIDIAIKDWREQKIKRLEFRLSGTGA